MALRINHCRNCWSVVQQLQVSDGLKFLVEESMHIQFAVKRWVLSAMASVAVFAMTSGAQTTGFNSYVQHNLVSDQVAVADHLDPNLVDPWGVCFSASSPFWVSDRGTGTSTLYNGFGQLAPLTGPMVVTIPRPASATGTGHATPTGCVQNAAGGFAIKTGTNASFIFDTEDGTIVAWASATGAVVKVDN